MSVAGPYVAMVVATAVAIVTSGVDAVDLWMYTDDNYSKQKDFKHFTFGITQRCYTIKHCFNDKASSASWTNAPENTEFVFFADENCEGDSVSSPSTPAGATKFSWWGLDKRVSSFIIYQDSVYPTAGLVQKCHESFTLVASNSTSSSFNVSDEVALDDYVGSNGSTFR